MLYMFWAFPFAIVAILFNVVFGAIPALLLRLLHLGKAADKWVFFHNAFLSDFLLFLLNVHPTVSGNIEELRKLRREGKPICYIANHTSMADILLIDGTLALGSGFIAKSSISYVFPVNLICTASNCVFISRTSLKKSARAIQKGVQHIKDGTPMTIFPEGTRSKTGEIAPFKHGSFKLALLSNAYIVPITIKGVRVALEDRKKLFSRTECHVVIGKPVPTEGLSRNVAAEVEQGIEQEIKNTYASL